MRFSLSDSVLREIKGSLIVGLMGLAIAAMSGLIMYLSTTEVPQEAHLIQNTPVVSISEVLANPEAYSTVAITGIAHSDQTLTSRLSQTPCIYCDVKVKEIYDNGNGLSRKIIEERINQVPFWLQEGADSIRVNTQNATVIELVTTKEIYRNNYQPVLPNQWVRPATTDYRYRYHYTEAILSLDKPIFVVGQLDTTHGEPQLIADPPLNQPLLISGQSRWSTLGAYEGETNFSFFVGGLIGIFGLIVMALAIIYAIYVLLTANDSK